MYRLLADKYGKVECLLRAGADIVKTIVDKEVAEKIIADNKMVESDLKGYPIATDNDWYFKGAVVEDIPPKKEKK